MIISKEKIMGIPYKSRGRGMDGMDCYGFVIYIEKCMGHELMDLLLDARVTRKDLNIEEVKQPGNGVIIEVMYKNHIHVGVCLDRRNFIHMTEQGVKIHPIRYFGAKKYYKVVDIID